MVALVGQTAERIFTKLSHVVDIRVTGHWSEGSEGYGVGIHCRIDSIYICAFLPYCCRIIW